MHRVVVLIIALLILPAAAARAESGAPYASLVGWYETEPGRRSLVTFGATGGLRIFDFDARRYEVLAPGDGEGFVWRRKDGERAVTFKRDSSGRAVALEWQSADGAKGSAKRDDGYGYLQEEVQFESGGVTLTGLLMLPRAKGPHAAAAFIHGSGDSDRDNVWAFTIANHLAMNGIAVLLPDKRGSGRSGGDWKKADFNVLAADAAAAVELLRKRPEVDRARVGLVGLSQGGWVAPLAASKDEKLAFVAAVSSASTTVGEQVAHELEQTFRKAGLGDAQIAQIMGILTLASEYMRTGEGWDRYIAARSQAPPPIQAAFMEDKSDWRWEWYRAVTDFDPIPLWSKLKAPSLVVYGSADERDNVPVAKSVERLKATKTEVKVYEGSGHAIEEPGTNRIRGDFLSFLSTWIRDATGAKS